MTTARTSQFVEVELSDLMNEGVLMAANERFFWPLGLALSWSIDREHGIASDLHVREHRFEDGHHEAIGTFKDDVVTERRERFQAWSAARIASLPESERDRAQSVAAYVETPEPDAEATE